MVSEMGGGQPPSPTASLPGAAHFDVPHPVGAVTVSHLPASPAAPSAADGHQSSPEAMVVDPVQQLSRSHSPSFSSGAAVAAALKQPADQQVSGFVPLSEVGGGVCVPQQQQAEQQQAEQEPSTCPVSSQDASQRADSPNGLSAGYESGDDMDVLNMQHCTNCTGTLWGTTCMDCGHMPSHDNEIFQPTVATAGMLHRPRLQGDALAVICWDERMELHEEAGSNMHPERPDRVRAVMARLQASELAARCRRLPAREATAAEIGACHIPDLLAAVDILSEQSRLQGNASLHFSPDTYVNQHTAMCAKLSAGACVDVATAVMRGEARAGMAVVRPPGHHAESNTAMGFCFFNNAGIAARAAQAAGAQRVLVLDWDVHHGNGTQHIFDNDPSVMYMSLHRYDRGSFYPGTGAAHEVGEGDGEGYSINVPWPCGGMRNGDYMAAFQHVVLPIAYEYAPDLVIISAGFDAAEGDPIGGCHLTPECYAHMTAQLQLVAPTVALLEGGYNLTSTAKGTEAVVRVLLGERPPQLPVSQQQTSEYAMGAVAQVMRIQSRYWECMRGLVQQQFKVLAAAAARQEHLAAMKQRRREAATAAPAGSEDGLAGSPGGGMCRDDEFDVGGEEVEDEEDQQVLSSMHHRAPAPGLEALDDAETDTPHQQYRGGSGWESDADLASGEQQLSHGGEAYASDEEAQNACQQPDEPQAGGGAQPRAAAAAAHGYASDASPLHQAAAHQHEQQQEQPAASDTLPLSSSEAPGSGSASDGSGRRTGGMTAASQEPPAGARGDVITPAGEQLLAASATPPTLSHSDNLSTAVAAAPTASRADSGASPQPEGAHTSSSGGGKVASAATAAGAHWKLSVKSVAVKRAHQSHQRLSPSLVDDEAMQQLRQPGQQQPQVPAAPQQQQEQQL